MALTSYARNVFGSIKQGDISVVEITLGAGAGTAALVSADSSPDCTVDAGSHAAGVYVVTFPSGPHIHSLGAETINKAAIKVAVTAVSSTNGVGTATLTTSDSSILAGTEQIHFTLLVGAP